jgi:RNA polymerase sigma factor (sigma-70 family)
LKEQTEKEQWQALLNGEVTAYEAIMMTHFRALFQYGSKFSSDRAFVKDCIQDLFLYLWEHREHLSREVHIKPYLMTSLRRRIHRKSNKNTDLFDASIMEESRLFEMEFSVEDVFIEHESSLILSKRVRNVLEALPKRQKEVVYLRFFQNLDREQIAQVMDIAPQTVSNILQMAFKDIRKQWNVEFFGTLLLLFLFT